MVRRRNGKRGKGMATKKEKTKEQRIKTEKTRLKGIFKDLDENKRNSGEQRKAQRQKPT